MIRTHHKQHNKQSGSAMTTNVEKKTVTDTVKEAGFNSDQVKLCYFVEKQGEEGRRYYECRHCSHCIKVQQGNTNLLNHVLGVHNDEWIGALTAYKAATEGGCGGTMDAFVTKKATVKAVNIEGHIDQIVALNDPIARVDNKTARKYSNLATNLFQYFVEIYGSTSTKN
jgi:hypothetical protein